MPAVRHATPTVRERDVSPNPGGLKMIEFRPPALRPGAPLVVVLHGCGQSAEAFAQAAGWIEASQRFGFALLLPEQASSNHPQRCFNWFSAVDIETDGGEAASIHQMILTALASGLDENRVYVAGLSAGGAMAAALLALYPDVFAGGAVIAAPPFGAAHSALQAFNAMAGVGLPPHPLLRARRLRARGDRTPRPTRLSIWHGDADAIVNPWNAEAVAAQFLPQGAERLKTLTEGRRVCKRWRDEDSGGAVEINLIRGLGHGAPLDGAVLGHAAPFVLEAGISSTLEILRFWGLAPRARASKSAKTRSPRRRARSALPLAAIRRRTPRRAPRGIGAAILKSLNGFGVFR
jgi:poly(hydroxyalkanoate) depolymerase family esterase